MTFLKLVKIFLVGQILGTILQYHTLMPFETSILATDICSIGVSAIFFYQECKTKIQFWRKLEDVKS